MIFMILACLIIPLVLVKIYALLTYKQCKSNVCLLNKTALVTGGNSGIGYETVLALASRGCRVIIADKVFAPDLKERILEETNNGDIVLKYVDLASFKSVREFAKDITQSEGKLDILINNAGIATTDNNILTEDGLDITMQVNYFSAFLLTHLLVGLLKKSPSRVIFTSSLLSFTSSFTANGLTSIESNNVEPVYSYSNSKLALIISSGIFASKLKQYGITCNTFHPGIVYTAIFRKTRIQGRKVNFTFVATILLEYLALLIGKTPQEGAQTGIYLACAKEVKNVTGKFFGELETTFKPRLANDEKFCQHIWKASEKIVKLEPHEKI